MKNIVHLIDNMEFMKDIPNNYYELAIVDPPYGIGNFSQSDARHKTVNWNNEIPQESYFKELVRISKKRVIWGANYYNCFECGNGALIWYKNVGHTCMSHCEIAAVSGQQKVDYIHINWSGGVRKSKTIHPCEKPVLLYKECLRRYAKPNDKIFDSHVGSGSIRIACYELGFDFEGCELDKNYWESQEKRFQEFRIKREPDFHKKIKPEFLISKKSKKR